MSAGAFSSAQGLELVNNTAAGVTIGSPAGTFSGRSANAAQIFPHMSCGSQNSLGQVVNNFLGQNGIGTPSERPT